MKFLVLILLLPLTLVAKQPESYFQNQFADKVGGETEVTLPDRTRADIVTDTHAIEVEFAPKWKEAIGQSLNYAFQTNKKAGIVMIVGEGDERYLLMLNSLILHYELPIEVWTTKI